MPRNMLLVLPELAPSHFNKMPANLMTSNMQVFIGVSYRVNYVQPKEERQKRAEEEQGLDLGLSSVVNDVAEHTA